MKATWASNVTITYGECTITYKSDGLPNHERYTEYALANTGVMVPTASTAHAADDPTVSQTYDVTLNTCPTYSATTTKAELNAIGYVISRAARFRASPEGNVAISRQFPHSSRMRERYKSDLTDEQWQRIEGLVPALTGRGPASAKYERREIVNAML